ncbi:efflux RND transporter periplasmic adaptor subunit [Amphritea japonica]|uniref:RND family efflux transporter MFP subunit n=1 Tax=Amphritea japonica ATCC BAA-1530 TaxID=1278309 RepID=A0A7R6SU96_9GAMM|nr:HlyD family efflux transporter periplasmic adaptor subunit [Amphritea japonica]BBB27467.1 RND family efflux transporter MFP subunit [Amphritea japonica ATCC BAA-1530]
MAEQTEQSFFHRHKRWMLPILIIAGAVLIFIALKATKPTAPSQPIQEKVWTVKVVNAEFASYSPQLSLYGRIESPSSSTLSSSINAYIESRHTSEGQKVDAGELLIQLDNRDASLALTQKQADVDRIKASIEAEKVRYQSNLKALKIEKELVSLTQRTLERYQDLSSRKLASQNQLDDARRTKQQQALSLNSRQQSINDHPNQLAQLTAQLKQATAQRDSAALDVERSQITAPFTGRIAEIKVATGERVRSGDALLTIYDLSSLEVRSQIPGRYLPQIHQQLDKGEEITATASLDGQPLSLTLERLAAAVNSGSAGVDALFRINSRDYRGEPGRALSLDLTMPQQDNLLALPPQAIFGTDRVYTLIDSRLQASTIERVGDFRDNQGQSKVLVRSSVIQADDQILVTQLPNAVTGLLVEVAAVQPVLKPAPTTAGAE